MKEYILLMHRDTTQTIDNALWSDYFASLSAKGVFDGGSSIGAGEALRKEGAAAAASDHLGGFIRVRALDLAAAKELVAGNPVYKAGGTVEVRELPQD